MGKAKGFKGMEHRAKKVYIFQKLYLLDRELYSTKFMCWSMPSPFDLLKDIKDLLSFKARVCSIGNSSQAMIEQRRAAIPSILARVTAQTENCSSYSSNPDRRERLTQRNSSPNEPNLVFREKRDSPNQS